MTESNTTDMGDSASFATLSCSLPAPDVALRRAEAARVFRASVARREIPGGMHLDYADDDETARSLLAFVLFERRCCSTLSYRLLFDEPHARTALEIVGAPERVAALRAWVAEM